MTKDSRSGGQAPGLPAGGYALVAVRDIAALWGAYRSGDIRIGDLRAYLACREAVERRCRLEVGREPHFAHDEVARLAGVSARRIRAALDALGRAGLLTWAGDAIRFGPGVEDGTGRDAAEAFLAEVANNKRLVPVPRRVLRLMACGARPALIATALGVAIRCLYRRRGGVVARGRIKATWIARAFGVDLRRVKQARRQLQDDGWITPEGGDTQWAMNRWGRAYAVDLDWDPDPRSDLPPPAGDAGADSPPPAPDRSPLPREDPKNQDPAGRGPAGVCNPGRRTPDPLPPPDLRDVRPADLQDAGRALVLHAQAAAAGLVGDSESGRLRVLAAAEHARSVGTRNPCGLFASVVRGGWWHHLTQSDEESASRRLRAHRQGPGPRMAPPAPPGARADRPGPDTAPARCLSTDARIVSAVRAELRGRADPYLSLRQSSAEWTRVRYDRAAAELAGSVGRVGPAHAASSLGAALSRLGGVAGAASSRPAPGG